MNRRFLRFLPSRREWAFRSVRRRFHRWTKAMSKVMPRASPNMP